VSMEVLEMDFIALLGGKELPPLSLQYKDFAQWQNHRFQGPEILGQQNYWLDRLAGDIPRLNIPVDYPRQGIQRFEGESIRFEPEEEETAALYKMIRSGESTLFMVLLTAFNVFLSKLCGQEDIIVGTPVVGRNHNDLQQIIGMFVNILVLRNYPSGHHTFSDFLAHVKDRTLKALENQDYQFEDLVEKIGAKRDMSRNPLFDVVFKLENAPGVPVPADEPRTEIDRSQPKPRTYEDPAYEDKTAKFDLLLTAIEMDRRLAFSLQYSTQLYGEETILRFIGFFRKIISSLIEA
ncbi:MAG: non-ribosomal peptide synthetase, partial [bacterium]|nr:non-ribosomal peptide synthetase [bacterium]